MAGGAAVDWRVLDWCQPSSTTSNPVALDSGPTIIVDRGSTARYPRIFPFPMWQHPLYISRKSYEEKAPPRPIARPQCRQYCCPLRAFSLKSTSPSCFHTSTYALHPSSNRTCFRMQTRRSDMFKFQIDTGHKGSELHLTVKRPRNKRGNNKCRTRAHGQGEFVQRTASCTKCQSPA